jgi:hypothetical protein
VLGWRRQVRPAKHGDGKDPVPVWERGKHARSPRHQRARKPVNSDSPFAQLANLIDVD